jgi:hypothetical protein
MRRTLEKLAQERQDKEEELARRLDQIRQKREADRFARNVATLEPILARLRESLKKEQQKTPARGSALSRLTRGRAARSPSFHEQVYLLLREQNAILVRTSL